MKPVYIVILMAAAAIGGALIARYSGHEVQIAQARSFPPPVVAPPVPPAPHMGPSNSVPVRSAPSAAPAPPPEKPSALSFPVHIGKPDYTPAPAPPRPAAPPTIVARTRIVTQPAAVIPLERNFTPGSSAAQAASPAPTPAAPPAPPVSAEVKEPAAVHPTLSSPESAVQPSTASPAEGNHATLHSGMLVWVRINEALSSNLNSPGDVFSGTLERPLVADGFVIAERGARVRGEVVESKSSKGAQGSPALAIRLREILASDGQRVHVVSQPWKREGLAYASNQPTGNVYDAALTRGGAAVIRRATSITFRLDETVELTEKRQ